MVKSFFKRKMDAAMTYLTDNPGDYRGAWKLIGKVTSIGHIRWQWKRENP